MWKSGFHRSRQIKLHQDLVRPPKSGALYRDVSGYPAPGRNTLQSELREYTYEVIEQAWPAQRQGRILDVGTRT